MDVKPRGSEGPRPAEFYWGLLAALVTLLCVFLTHLITHVDSHARRSIGFSIENDRPIDLLGLRPSAKDLESIRFTIPRVALVDYKQALFIITPGVRSVSMYAEEPLHVSCGSSAQIEASAPTHFFSELAKAPGLEPLPVRFDASPSVVPLRDDPLSGLPAVKEQLWKAAFDVPADLRAKLAHTPDGQALIRCEFADSLAASPTFSGRFLMAGIPLVNTGIVALDLSAFDGISALSFGGGIAVPVSGDRVRFLDPDDRLVTAEWTDEAAAEQRDVILVLIGGLAAVAAAMAIEAIRPSVERRARGGS